MKLPCLGVVALVLIVAAGCSSTPTTDPTPSAPAMSTPTPKPTPTPLTTGPVTPGRYPALVLDRGFIDPAVYTNGRGLMREQDHLARRGYVVLHTDYRNHAQSSKDPQNETNPRIGYTEDVINAVLALKASPYADPRRVALFGRSMSGGITALKKAGKQSTLYTYSGEEHTLAAAWSTSMARTVAFLKQQGV